MWKLSDIWHHRELSSIRNAILFCVLRKCICFWAAAGASFSVCQCNSRPFLFIFRGNFLRQWRGTERGMLAGWKWGNQWPNHGSNHGVGGVARAHCRQVKAIARSAVHSHYCIEERERVKEEYSRHTICVCNSLVLSIDFSRHTNPFYLYFFTFFPRWTHFFALRRFFPHHQVIQKPSFLVVAFFQKCALESLFMLGRFDLGDQKA